LSEPAICIYCCHLSETMEEIEIREFSAILFNAIDGQIGHNRDVNLFSENHLPVFTKQIGEIIRDQRYVNLMNDSEFRRQVTEYTVQKVLAALFDANQFIEVTSQQREKLSSIYTQLFLSLSEQPDSGTIAAEHYCRLSLWLVESNPYLSKINPPDRDLVARTVCAGYTPEFQLDVLGIVPQTLSEPVLDLGCGESALLVAHLRDSGINTWGLDRHCTVNEPWIIKHNWFEFDFEPGKWGTILSNMAFSLHFLHHQMREDGNYLEYAQKYSEIIRSLKHGGCFHYAPSLPQIEAFLPAGLFLITRCEITAGLYRTAVTRL